MLAVGYGLKVFFFAVVGKDPVEITTTDVLGVIAAQRLPVHRGNVVCINDGEKGLSAGTTARRPTTRTNLPKSARVATMSLRYRDC